MSKSPDEVEQDYARWCYRRLRQLEQIERPLRSQQDRDEIDSLTAELRARYPGAF